MPIPVPPAADRSPAPDFDALAGPYRWLEYLSFGPLLQRSRTEFLPQLTSCQSALVLGDGDGRFTAALLRCNRVVRVHAVDASPAMLRALTQQALPDQSRLSVEQADIRHWSPHPGKNFDVIATHFFLDCLTTAEIRDLAARISPWTSAGAAWVFSDFSVPPTIYGRIIAAPLVALLYRAFRLLTHLRPQALPDHAAVLRAAGWTLANQHSRLGGLLVSQLWRRTPCIPAAPESVS